MRDGSTQTWAGAFFLLLTGSVAAQPVGIAGGAPVGGAKARGVVARFEPLRVLAPNYGARGEQGLRPLSLASADFDGDGVPDLVAGYGRRGSGILVLYRGNLSSIYPNAREAHARRERTEAPFPFPGEVMKAPARPDLLFSGDFDADGAMDLAMASTRAHEVAILRGDGKGGFAGSQQLSLPGALTAMAAGDINRVDGPTDLVIGIKGASGGRLLLFQSPFGAISAVPDAIDLPDVPTSILLGRLDTETLADVAVIAGRHLIVVHGRDGLAASRAQASAYVTEQATFPSPIAGGAVGDFDGDLKPEIALLFSDASVRYAAIDTLLEAVRAGKAPVDLMPHVPRAERSSPRGARLQAAKVSSGPGTDLLLVDPGSKRIRMLASPTDWEGADAELELNGLAPRVVLPMRLNADGLADLVILNEADLSVGVALTAPTATFSVTNTLDGGPGSLRYAIEQANTSPGADLITFNILPSGSKSIQPASSLPSIFEAVTIDGTTQPGFTGTPIIELDGVGAGSADGLDLLAGPSVIRGLAINRWTTAVYTSPSAANVIEGNYIGVDFTGAVARPNTYGVLLWNGNTCGGSTYPARNIVSGNLAQGIVIYGSSNAVKLNFIGTDASGSAALGNFTGIKIWDGSNNLIGGDQGLNLVSGNFGSGIEIGPGSGAGNRVEGNWIGTKLDCAAALPNGLRGLEINATRTGNITGNLISGNAQEGILIANGGTQNAIYVNRIGTSCSNMPLGNGKNGVRVLDGVDNHIGLGPYGANFIAYNGEPGVLVASGTGNRIEANRIFDNEGLGIDLGPGTFSNGVTLNDADDTDAGANGLQNFPNLVTASSCGSTTKILTGFGSRPSSSYQLEYYYNDACDSTGWGEGRYLLPLAPIVTTGGSGGVSFEINQPAFVPGGSSLTATATDALGNTSEFSYCLPVTDLTPSGEATNLVWQAGSKTQLSWQPVSGATTYRLQRGVRADLPDLLTPRTDACWRLTTQTTSTGAVLTETPTPGTLFWYLVTPVISYCEGTSGDASAGPRSQDSGLLCADSQSCQHSHCVGGVQLASTCDPCVAAVCAQDPYCCGTNWDSACIGEVRTICGSLACLPSQGACAHSLCSIGGPLTAGCDEPPIPSCVARICADSPTCCSTAWDAACVAMVAGTCGEGCY